MSTNDFKRWNLILGWIVFGISFLVYSLTVEPTVSFWDSGEYIATSAKLQVAHPPGAPLLQMIGAFFALFATDKSQIALMVNYVSVVSSAFTILFLFWTITNLLQKLLAKTKTMSSENHMAILGSGTIGALAFTFSDSFWFNATETEVYSTASLIMALLLWLGLKWTDNLDSSRGNKWLLLISFVVGLTFGVQFMGFLAIPSHDAQVVTYNGPDTEYSGKEIYIGANEDQVIIADVTDKDNPLEIATVLYPDIEYTHQGWFTEDQRYFILGDERDEFVLGFKSRTLIFDLTDLDNPELFHTYLGPTSAIDHNGYVKGNEFFLANYTAGLRVLDISEIATKNVTEISFFDTYPENDTPRFDGVWSVYPYFESGKIVLSDVSGGLFVIKKSN